ncbi:MAG: thioredoxin family protein [Rickettsiales bacterium]|jgi:peroxiredoxin|nr:thioredoxin family protein [Rickettsiales bacterium]
MPLIYSAMLDLGTELPKFELENTINKQMFSSDSLSQDKGRVIMFICNHCPYVIHYHQQIIAMANKYLPDIEFVAISSNDANRYHEDSPEKMHDLAKKLDFPFPYLYDETQSVAKKYKAACTPDFYLFDQSNLLIYRGRLDDSSPGSQNQATGNELRNVLDDFLAGNEISNEQNPSMGCSIKWK